LSGFIGSGTNKSKIYDKALERVTVMNRKHLFSMDWSFIFFALALLLPAPRVASAGAPDLVITSISASPHILAPGDAVTITATVQNQGDGDAGYFRTGFYLSTDPAITTSGLQIGSPKGNETDSLKAGDAEPFAYRTNMISAGAGVYYIGAVADYRNQVAESNESNNSLAGNRVLIARSEPVASGGAHSLILKSDGTLWAWGQNSHGQLGDGTKAETTIPVQIGKDSDWVAIATGRDHSLALKSDGTLWAWGKNSHGQLGDGTKADKTVPARIGKGTNWIGIEAGDLHSVGLKSDGTLWAWGNNSHGQLGDGTTVDKTAPVQIGKDAPWARVSAGAFHTVALKKDMTLWAWGNNSHGQLGEGTTKDKAAPVRIGTEARWVSVSAGDYHTVALNLCDGCLSTYTLWAWGINKYGQLGDGTTTDRTSPIRIGTDTIWAKVAAGSHHALALKKDGTLWAWGVNSGGQLGDGTTENKNSPVRIGTQATWISVSAGRLHSLALKSDDTLWSWGGNSHGQLGDGTTADKTAPVRMKGPEGPAH
jgi:alpha-tubulin suppressor-like RCC1 family protein